MPDSNVLCVALDVPLATLFDYLTLEGETIGIGERVAVPFGKRERVGVVVATAESSELPRERLKPATRALRDAPPLPGEWLELMRFLSGYYQRPLGETVISSLPPRLRSLKPLPKKALLTAVPAAAELRASFVTGHALTAEQLSAVRHIEEGLGAFHPVLLHGVTGSGKTEVYLHAIARVLDRKSVV